MLLLQIKKIDPALLCILIVFYDTIVVSNRILIQKNTLKGSTYMNILEQYKDSINGTFSFFDRIIIKGHLNQFFTSNGAGAYASKCNVLLKDFSKYAEGITNDLKQYVEDYAKNSNRRIIYVNSPNQSKEDIVIEELKRLNIEEGLICIISSVETCFTLAPIKNNVTGYLELKKANRKCLHYYFYLKDRKLGYMFFRLQTWFPFEASVYINGRELIKPLLDENNIEYTTYDNSFSYLSDINKAQDIANKLVDKAKDISTYLDSLADIYNPYLKTFKEITGGQTYRWYLYQIEYATDIMFKDRKSLEDIYPSLVNYSFNSFNCNDVFTFLGRRLDSRFSGETLIDYKHRPIGYRVKFKLNSNHLKFYDKNNCLRVELTINNPYEFRIMKKAKDKYGKEVKRWVPMGKALCNLYRYAQIGKECNNRMISSLSNIVPVVSVNEDIEKVSKRKKINKRNVSAYNLLDKETYFLFQTISNGNFIITGFNNKDIRDILYSDIDDKTKRSNKTTRTLRKLRDHNLIKKISHSSRYLLTKKGRQITSAIIQIKEKEYPLAAAKFA